MKKIAKPDNSQGLSGSFYNDIRQIITEAQATAVRSINFQRVQMYWRLGERIFVGEQRSAARAEYGTYLIKNLAMTIEPEFGSGFSYRQLAYCRQFYRLYPIVNALRSQFNWSQYRLFSPANISYTCLQKSNCFQKSKMCWT